jgi:type II secretory pathway pseudopilin PulG
MTRHHGFTLLELVIVLGITVIIFGALSVVISTSFRSIWSGSGRDAAADRAAQVMDLMVRTIRQSQSSPTGAYPIVNATNNSLTIFASTGASNVVEQIRFFINGTNLQRGVIQPVGDPPTYPTAQENITTLLTNIENAAQPLFEYFNNQYDGSQSPMDPITISDISVVRITAIFDSDPAKPPRATTIRGAAQLRNLKTNY